MILKAIASLHGWIHTFPSCIENFKNISIDELFLFFMVSAIIGNKKNSYVIIEQGIEYVSQRKFNNVTDYQH